MAPPPSHSQAVLPSPETLVLERIERQENEFRIFVRNRQPPSCPDCGRCSRSRHSGYTRKLADVPWQGCAVRLFLDTGRYRCPNPDCPRKVFCQRVPGVARIYARQTERLADIVGAVGYVAGGLPGARLLHRLAIRISDDTVRRKVIGNAPRQPGQAGIHLGVEDWAWRKYHTYGTILVDLDRHQVTDLLCDRTAESLALWLSQHPTVKIVTRDRCGWYAEGASQAAPQADQIADRFHLVLNLSTAIERVLEQRSPELVLPPVEPSSAQPSPAPAAPQPTAQQTLQLQRRQRRLERYQQAAELYEKGCSRMAISRELDISIKTIRRWLRAGKFPERKPPVGRKMKVAE